jgi:hypothetical protein
MRKKSALNGGTSGDVAGNQTPVVKAVTAVLNP